MSHLVALPSHPLSPTVTYYLNGSKGYIFFSLLKVIEFALQKKKSSSEFVKHDSSANNLVLSSTSTVHEQFQGLQYLCPDLNLKGSRLFLNWYHAKIVIKCFKWLNFNNMPLIKHFEHRILIIVKFSINC